MICGVVGFGVTDDAAENRRTIMLSTLRDAKPDRSKRLRVAVRPVSVLPISALFGMVLSGYALAAEPQFGGYCAEGLTMHKLVKTDCSINWTSADGKLYCFSSPTSKAKFLLAPADNIKKAEANYKPTP
jgi:YHS domain-containing protein